MRLITCIICFFICSKNYWSQECKMYHIAKQKINLYHLVNNFKLSYIQEMKEFEISSFVTYGEYKKYLEHIKQDSSLHYYKQSLPNPISLPVEVRANYLNSTKYDLYPVIGVSWESTLNFLKWKTLIDNKTDSLKFIYRLPNCSEWIAANYYLETNKIPNDFNKYFSDWTLNTFDESSYDFTDHGKYFAYDYFYFGLRNDAKVLKRKRIIGNSFLHQHQYIYMNFYHYSMEGVRDVGFRYVKDDYVRLNEPREGVRTVAESVLNYWQLNKK